MPKILNLVGQRFGHVVVVARTSDRKGPRVLWQCQCDCGGEKLLDSHSLRARPNVSCGCMVGGPTHGMSDTRLHNIWMGMLKRCKSRSDYAGRGITVCERWRSFENFIADMQAGYQPGLLLDRRNTLGNYEPGTCRWVTPLINARNRRDSVCIELDGACVTLKEACETHNAIYSTVYKRLKRGVPVAQLFGFGC